jgi:hypothetical protein
MEEQVSSPPSGGGRNNGLQTPAVYCCNVSEGMIAAAAYAAQS